MKAVREEEVKLRGRVEFVKQVGFKPGVKARTQNDWLYFHTAASCCSCRVVSAKEYCQLENFDASCPEGAVILMRHAEYGRMNLGRCLTRKYYVGCVANVIRQMDQKCSGRRQCHVPVPEHSLLEAVACPADLVAYLDADYTCITGKLTCSSISTSVYMEGRTKQLT